MTHDLRIRLTAWLGAALLLLTGSACRTLSPGSAAPVGPELQVQEASRGDLSERPTAVILMIGDGMGFPQVTFARDLLLAPGDRWAFEQLPITGIVSTRSESNLTTDSAAAATAMSSGAKTSNQRIGTTASGESAPTIAEAAQAGGWRVGFVTTTAVTHATPAAFYAHVEDRYSDVGDIGQQLLTHQPDVVLGGGFGSWEEESAQVDTRRGELVRQAQAAGYSIWSTESPRDARPEKLMGLLADDHFPFRLDDLRETVDRRRPALAELTRIALDVLSRDGKPFFLMVEGGRIDHACHSFDATTSAYEVEDFSRATAVVREFMEDHPRTLVVVTADHATGGLAINDYADWEALRRQRASAEWMASQIRDAGAGVEMVREMTGFDDVTDEEIAAVRDEPDKYDAWRLMGKLLSRRNGITWVPHVGEDTKGHTGEDVPLYAGGPGAERFQGVLDNTDIAKRIFEISGLSGTVPAGDG